MLSVECFNMKQHTVSMCSQYNKLLMRYLLSLYEVFIIWCVFYPYKCSQFELATFQVLKSHVWLADTCWTVQG